MKSALHFALAETDPIFRQVLTESLTRNPFLSFSFAAGNGYEFMHAFRRKRIDLALLDLFMPVLSGFEAIRLLRTLDRQVPVIGYTPTYQPDIAALLQPLGVIYCEKKSAAILTVVDGVFKWSSGGFDQQAYLAAWEKETTEKTRALTTEHPEPAFSTTELRLMKLTYEGLTNKEMAAKLHLSPRTVDTYINRLTEKLGLRSKTDLIRYTVEHGLYNTAI